MQLTLERSINYKNYEFQLVLYMGKKWRNCSSIKVHNFQNMYSQWVLRITWNILCKPYQYVDFNAYTRTYIHVLAQHSRLKSTQCAG
jgi:hypothetical protein